MLDLQLISVHESWLQDCLNFGDVIPDQVLRHLTLTHDALQGGPLVPQDPERPAVHRLAGNIAVQRETQWLDLLLSGQVQDGVAVRIHERDIHAIELRRRVADGCRCRAVGDTEVRFGKQSRCDGQDLLVAADGAGIAIDTVEIQLDHALAGQDSREMIASVRVGQGVSACVQRHHRTSDTGLAAVLPTIAVVVIEDLADDGSQIE